MNKKYIELMEKRIDSIIHVGQQKKTAMKQIMKCFFLLSTQMECPSVTVDLTAKRQKHLN